MRQPLNIIYLSNERFPSMLACTIQQMVMCEAFAKSGAHVQLVCPHYFDMPDQSAVHIQEFYDVESLFDIKKLFSLLSLSKPLVDGKKHLKIPLVGGFSVLFSTWLFALKLLLRGRLDQTIVYSRNVNGAFVFLQLKNSLHKNLKLFFEVHSLDQQHPGRFFHKILREYDGLICITEALKDEIIKRYHVTPDNIFVAPDGVRKKLLRSRPPSRESARARLGITFKKIVLYAGQLLPGKGAEVFVDASAFFDDDVQFLVVGGHGTYLNRLQEKIKNPVFSNVTVTGFVPPAKVPLYQAAADALVLPATADHEISAYTSPLKLFEYMAAQRPIVASDLPVLKEVLTHGKNALLFKERDAADLAEKIKLVLNDDILSKRLAGQAWQDVQKLTWEERAIGIVDFMQKSGTDTQ